jgi:hypothetical protein
MKMERDLARLQREPQNPHLPAAMRPASSPVKSALTRSFGAASPANERARRVSSGAERNTLTRAR